jgi:hypothetical protein
MVQVQTENEAPDMVCRWEGKVMQHVRYRDPNVPAEVQEGQAHWDSLHKNILCCNQSQTFLEILRRLFVSHKPYPSGFNKYPGQQNARQSKQEKDARHREKLRDEAAQKEADRIKLAREEAQRKQESQDKLAQKQAKWIKKFIRDEKMREIFKMTMAMVKEAKETGVLPTRYFFFTDCLELADTALASVARENARNQDRDMPDAGIEQDEADSHVGGETNAQSAGHHIN